MSLDITRNFSDQRKCWFCHSTMNLHRHHIYFGNANRKISEQNGFVVYLCYEHHEGNQGVHHNIENNIKLRKECERWYLKQGHTKEDFIKLIGHNYL